MATRLLSAPGVLDRPLAAAFHGVLLPASTHHQSGRLAAPIPISVPAAAAPGLAPSLLLTPAPSLAAAAAPSASSPGPKYLRPAGAPSPAASVPSPTSAAPAATAPSTPAPYTKERPFVTELLGRARLTKPGSGKNTQHLVIDLKGSGLRYQCGDSLGVFPANDPLVVARTVFALGVPPDTPLAKHANEPLERVLSHRLNISRVPGALAKWVLERNAATNRTSPALAALQAAATDGAKLGKYLESFEVWDFLQHHNQVAPLDPNEVVDKLGTLLPRLYSISSAQAKVGEEVHLSVAMVEYQTNGHKRAGVATNFLLNRLPVHDRALPIYVQSSDFKPPKDPNAPMIMIGPGTGVAPFRAFLQHREVTGAKGPNWLFFGEWNRATDFFYEEYFRELEAKGLLRLDAAFSRDQGAKVYVQHLMEERGAEVWRWLEQGAAVYVCGDASRMAKDVDKALHRIIEQHGRRTPKEAREYVKALRQSHRYQRDIY